MAYNYTPVPTYHATVALPNDGDPAIAESVDSPMEDLADGLAYGVGPMATGGTIVLGGALTLQGSGIVFDVDDVSFAGDAVFGTNPGNTFAVNSTAEFNGNVALGSSVADTIQINGTLGVTGNATIGLNGGNTLSVISSATFSNNVTMNGVTEVTTSLEVSGTLETTGTVELNSASVTIGTASTDSFEVLSGTLFRSSVTIGNDAGTELLTVNAPSTFEDTVEFNANVEIGNSGTELNVNAQTLFRSGVTIGNSVSDEATITSALTISNLAAPMGFTGDGRVVFRVNDGPNANATIDLDSQDVLYVPTLTADRVYNVAFDNEVEGSWCWIMKKAATTGKLDILYPGGTATFLAADSVALLLVYHSGAVFVFPRLDN